jgi:hypothetical protein
MLVDVGMQKEDVGNAAKSEDKAGY